MGIEAVALGARLAVGRTAEIYAWGEGQVLKLFYDWMPPGAAEYEAGLGRVVHAAGLPAPAVGDVVELDDRLGVLYARVDGPTLGSDLRRQPWRLARAARLLAELHAGMHALAVPGLPAQRERLRARIHSARPLPDELKEKCLHALDDLPDGDRVCHGDFHPENVLLARSGPVTIDWIDATGGQPLADVARTCLLMGSASPSRAALPAKIEAWANQRFVTLYLKYYFDLRPGGREQLARWEPLVAAARLSEGIVEEEARLLALARRIG